MSGTPRTALPPTLLTDAEHVSVDWLAVHSGNAVKVNQLAVHIVAVHSTSVIPVPLRRSRLEWLAASVECPG
jgi:hypothetical protein